jgi:putative NADPH-quinone reductase
MTKKIFILLGHSDKETLSGALATAYEEAAKAVGHEVRRTNIGDLSFDPILHKGYKVIQELEPDLKKVQEDMKWADHFVLVYPNWWCTMPALLKGMIDRLFLPGFAFRFKKTPSGEAMGWDKLLAGKSARVVVLSNTAPLLIEFMFGDYTNEIGRSILGFAGYSVSYTKLGPAEKRDPSVYERWKKKLGELGRRGV